MYRALLAAAALVASAAGTSEPLAPPPEYVDAAVACEPGYKLAALAREVSPDTLGGVMSAACEPVAGDPAEVLNPVCADAPPMECLGGEFEGCKEKHSYLGGVTMYQLDETTGAYLLQPLCCIADNVAIDHEQCEAKGVSGFKQPFEFSAPAGMVFKDFQCFLLKDRQERVHDTILRPRLCPAAIGDKEADPDADYGEFGPQGAAGAGGASSCDLCACECGPYDCPPGRRLAAKVAHRRQRRDTCHCECHCTFSCLPDDQAVGSDEGEPFY